MAVLVKQQIVCGGVSKYDWYNNMIDMLYDIIMYHIVFLKYYVLCTERAEYHIIVYKRIKIEKNKKRYTMISIDILYDT